MPSPVMSVQVSHGVPMISFHMFCCMVTVIRSHARHGCQWQHYMACLHCMPESGGRRTSPGCGPCWRTSTGGSACIMHGTSTTLRGECTPTQSMREQRWLARCMCFSFLCCCEFFNVLPVDSSVTTNTPPMQGERKPWHNCRNENNKNKMA